MEKNRKRNPEVKNALEGKRVAIIGGGPGGAFTAYLLAKQGVHVDIFEPRPLFMSTEGKKPHPCTGCAGLLQQDALDILAQAGLDLPDKVVRKKIEEIAVHIPGRADTIHIPTKSVTVYRGYAPIHQAQGDNIHSFDAWLLQEAVRMGAIHHETKVTSVSMENNSAKIISEIGDPINADLIIGAYGYNTIQMTGLHKAGWGRDRPTTKQAGVREYRIHKDLGQRVNVFANPTKTIRFAMILPKGGEFSSEEGALTTIALMGHTDIKPQDFAEFLNLQGVKDLMGEEIGQTKPKCGCLRDITTQSPRSFMSVDESGQLREIRIGDAGPTRLYKNGMFAALDGANNLVRILTEDGINKQAMNKYRRYMTREYVRDNVPAAMLMRTINTIMGHKVTRNALMEAAHSQDERIKKLTLTIMDYVLSGQGPYWQLPHEIWKEACEVFRIF